MKGASRITFAIFMMLIVPSLVLAGSATLHWQPNTEPDLAGYRIYYGTSSRSYGTPIWVDKNTTSYTIDNLTEGKTYYFALTAVDTSGNESGYSQEVSKSIVSSSGEQATVVDNISDSGGSGSVATDSPQALEPVHEGSTGNESGYSQEVSKSIVSSSGEQATVVDNISVSPCSGRVAAGSRQAFEAVYECSTGAGELKAVFFMLNKKVSRPKGIYLKYDVVDNKIYLRTNSGKRWKGGYAPGSDNVIENKNGRVYCAATSVHQDGTTLRVRWMVMPFERFAGRRNLYMRAKAKDGTITKWEKMGTVSITKKSSN